MVSFKALPFKELYEKEIRQSLVGEFGFENPMLIPRVKKICLNMSCADGAADALAQDLALIAGQKPVITKARQSIAAWKVREGMPLGCKVTLRRDAMYHFMERLVLLVLPRMRSFYGFTHKNFDGRGNMSFGVNEHFIFPEIDYEKVQKTRGVDVTIVTSAARDKEALGLLKGFYFPFPEQ